MATQDMLVELDHASARHAKRVRFFVAVYLFGLAMLARCLTWPQVLGTGRWIGPDGADEYYHMRRIWFSTARFPEILERDPYSSFPFGNEIIWPPGFDWTIAAVARLLVGQDQRATEILAAWFPPVLGSLLVLVVAWIAGRTFRSTAAAVVAGSLLAILPAHLTYSAIGVVDHHVAASLIGACLLGGSMAIARGASAGSWSAFLALGVGAASFLLVWTGALLPLLVLQVMAGCWAIFSADARLAGSRAARLASSFALAAALLAPFGVGRHWSEFGSFSPLVPGSFQPAWFAATALGAVLLAGLWRFTRLGVTRVRRAGSAALLAGAGACICLVSIPALATTLGKASGWFAKAEPFQHTVVELVPLFDVASVGGAPPEMQFSGLLFAFPVAFVWLVGSAWRRGATDRWLLAAWCGFFAAATLSQVRFKESFAPAYAIVMGGALVSFARALTSRLGIERRLAVAIASLLTALASTPVYAYYTTPVSKLLAFARGATLPLGLDRHSRSYLHAAEWLRENSPPTSGPLDPEAHPEYSVLCSWGFGHLVHYVAERPVVQDNFGVYGRRAAYDLADRYFRSRNEDLALAIAERLGVRYVFSDATGSGQGGADTPDAMRTRLFRRGIGFDAAGKLVEGLTRHRLVYDRSDVRVEAPLRVFELVQGARIEGRARPGSSVEIQIGVRALGAAAVTWISRASADDTGRYALRVPYPTGAQGRVKTGGHYVLSSDGQRGELAISEQAVRSGARIPGPDLTAEG